MLDELRSSIARLERSGAVAQGRSHLPFGHPALDAGLPGGGLLLSAVHEVAGAGAAIEHGTAAALFVAGVLARLPGPVLWALERRDLFAPGLAGVGLQPERILYAEAGKPASVLLVVEEGLRHRGLAGVVGELTGRLTLTASRRLQLAAEASGVVAILLRAAAGRTTRRCPSRAPPPRAGASPPCPRRPRCGTGRRCRASPARAGGSTSCAATAASPVPGWWRRAMRRVVAVWLPTWSTDRLRLRSDAPPPGMPLVTTVHDGHRRVIAAADRAALALGLRPGRALAQAQTAVPDLAIADADPEGDTAALGRLAAWCLHYAPLTAPDPPDGVLLDITGCAHLRGGEAALVDDLLGCLSGRGYAARAAVAGTIGAAHALARYAAEGRPVLSEPGGDEDAVSPLPVAALRLPAGTVGSLHRIGLEHVGQLLAASRAPLARRFGTALLRRLDQATGRAAELLEPRFPPETVQHRLAFVEPLSTAEAFTTVIGHLVREVCTILERAGQGARQLDLLFERVDGTVQAVRVGTARPSRDPRHLGRLLDERIETVDPGAGVEAMRLVVTLAEPLAWTQAEGALTQDALAAVDLSVLVDRLVNRLGAGRVFRVEPVESDVPERSVRPVPPLGARAGGSWPPTLPRPTRLFTPPQPVDALSALPDHPPAAFTWRGKRRRVRRADGPERICGEWWRRDGEIRAVRDYWQVEDETGCRYWLFRRGDGANRATGDLSWFLHGLF